MGFFSAVFSVVASGAIALWFHVSDHQFRRSSAKRLRMETNLSTHSMTEAHARGHTRGLRALALAFDFFFIFFLGWFLTPLLPEWDAVLGVGGMTSLLIAIAFMAMFQGIVNHNRPQWLVQPERRAEPGVRQLRHESSHR